MDEKNNSVVTYKAAEYTEKYSNNLSVQSGALDFSLRFGRSIRPEPGQEGPLLVEYFAGIILSPPEAKLFAAMLSDEVRRYEQCFGALPAVNQPAPAESPEAAAVAASSEVIQ